MALTTFNAKSKYPSPGPPGPPGHHGIQFDQNAPPGIKDPILTIENIVATFALPCTLNLSDVFAALLPYGAMHHADNRRVQIHIRGTSISIHPSVFVSTGAKSLDNAIQAALELIIILMKYECDSEQHPSIRNSMMAPTTPMFYDPDLDPLHYSPISSVILENMVLTVRTGCAVSLQAMGEFLPNSAYSLVGFPGRRYHYEGKNADGSTWKCAMIFFGSGSIIITGLTNYEHINEAARCGTNVVWLTWTDYASKSEEEQKKIMVANGVVSFGTVVNTGAAILKGEQYKTVTVRTVMESTPPQAIIDVSDITTLSEPCRNINKIVEAWERHAISPSEQEEEMSKESPSPLSLRGSPGLKRSIDSTTAKVGLFKKTSPSPLRK
jgi:TATA-box binding protein (TBP) (component of TFIID and TFIIIB)